MLTAVPFDLRPPFSQPANLPQPHPASSPSEMARATSSSKRTCWPRPAGEAPWTWVLWPQSSLQMTQPQPIPGRNRRRELPGEAALGDLGNRGHHEAVSDGAVPPRPEAPAHTNRQLLPLRGLRPLVSVLAPLGALCGEPHSESVSPPLCFRTTRGRGSFTPRSEKAGPSRRAPEGRRARVPRTRKFRQQPRGQRAPCRPVPPALTGEPPVSFLQGSSTV